MTDPAPECVPSFRPYLVLYAAAAAWISFSGIHRFHNSDSIVPSLTSRYAWNINADTGIFSTHDTSGNARHNVDFTATAPGGYRLDISTSRVGELSICAMPSAV